MRAALVVGAGAAALVGVGLYARPGEPTPASGGKIVVVRGGAGVPVAHAVPVAVSPLAEPSPIVTEDYGDPGIWATPAEFAPPERD